MVYCSSCLTLDPKLPTVLYKRMYFVQVNSTETLSSSCRTHFPTQIDQHTFPSATATSRHFFVVQSDANVFYLKFWLRLLVLYSTGQRCEFDSQGKCVRQDDEKYACIFTRRKIFTVNHESAHQYFDFTFIATVI